MFDGALIHPFSVRFTSVGTTFALETADGVFTDQPEVFILGTGPTQFHAIKLVVDVRTDRYVRLLVDDTEVDISDVSTTPNSNLGNGRLVGGVLLIGDSGQNDELIVDDLIFTQNEPL